MRDVTDPTVGDDGTETHPAFGLISAGRVSTSPPGAVLFDSEIKHQHSVVLRIGRASRRRELNHDWIHPQGPDLIEVQMSEAQWASFVSSMNTSGVPCTIRRTPDDWTIPEVPYAPRMTQASKETREAAASAFGQIADALAAYEERKTAENLRRLRAVVTNAVPDVEFATSTLASHVEGVVQRARADVEAFVAHHASTLGIDAGGMSGALAALPAGEATS